MIPFFDPMRRAHNRLRAALRPDDTLQLERQLYSVSDSVSHDLFVIRINRPDGPFLFTQDEKLRTAVNRMLDTLKK